MERVTAVPAIPRRAPDSHKGTYGRVIIFAGSPGMGGAAVLAARAALRTGSGLVTAAVPTSLSGAVVAAVPEATQLLLPEPLAAGYRERLEEALGGGLDRFQPGAIAIGPGIGTAAGSRDLLERVLAAYGGPQVLDADALNILAERPELCPRPLETRVWTPHPGEFQRLTGGLPRGEDERVVAAAAMARARGGIVVLKGHRTVVTDGERFYVNDTGNPGMATGGAGDVLTGIIVSLLGQGFPAFAAACLGVRLHGRAGDLAAARLGEASLVAGDIIESLPAATREHAAGAPAAGPGAAKEQGVKKR